MSEEKTEVTREDLEGLLWKALGSARGSERHQQPWVDTARLLLESLREREKEAKKRSRGIGAPRGVSRDS